MQRERLPQMLGISEPEIDRLFDCGLILPRPASPTPRRKIDYQELAASYRDIMAQMHFRSHPELARHLGVSRVWVSRVLKRIQRRES